MKQPKKPKPNAKAELAATRKLAVAQDAIDKARIAVVVAKAKAAKKKNGRPPFVFTKELEDFILASTASGISLMETVDLLGPEQKGFHGEPATLAAKRIERNAKGEEALVAIGIKAGPSYTTVMKHLRENESFALNYAHAREDAADAHNEEIVAVSRSTLGCGDSAQVNAARLHIDTLKWRAGKMKAKVYGDSSKLTIEGHLDIRKKPDAELDSELARLIDKAGKGTTSGFADGAGTAQEDA